MERKTKKMVATEAEIAAKTAERSDVNKLMQDLEKFEVNSQNGRDAKSQAKNELESRHQALTSDLMLLESQLEVQTVEMLVGKDTDFAEPTARESLANAS